jgi:hypothetical protein
MDLVKPTDRRKLWKPGQSGNPAGRPKGAKNKVTLMKIALEGELRTQLGPHMASILAKAIDMANKGDASMIKLLVDKTIPTTKASDEEASDKEKIVIQIGRLPERADESIPINAESVEVR